jgi:DNA-binding NtrC family response regulator
VPKKRWSGSATTLPASSSATFACRASTAWNCSNASRQRDRSLPVVLITGHGDISMAVGAMQKGAYDFMEKPFSPERLVDVARRALEQRSLAREVSSLRRQLAERDSLEGASSAARPPCRTCAN